MTRRLLEVCVEDAHGIAPATAAEAGLAGIVIGASLRDHRLDRETLAAWIALARDLGAARGRPLSLTLHRAFDLVPDLPVALDTAVALGFDRILTSGGQPQAFDAVPMLTTLVARAAGRIVILAGSGVSATTLPAILASGVTEVHASCRAPLPEQDETLTRFGFSPATAKATDVETVAGLITMLRAAET